MSWIVYVLIGMVIGFVLSWTYSFITDKINMIKLGYSGGSFIIKWIYNKYFKKDKVCSDTKK